VETFLLAHDSFVAAGKNYYMYHQRIASPKWSMVPHDFDQIASSSSPWEIYAFMNARGAVSPLVSMLLAVPEFNTTFQAQFRTLVYGVFGAGRNADVPSPAERYRRMFNFTWGMVNEDRFWLLSNGVSDYSSYKAGADAMIGFLPARFASIQAQLDSYLPPVPPPEPEESGLSTAAKWGIGVGAVVVLGVVAYCCWSRSRRAQYEDASGGGRATEKEPIGFGTTPKTYGKLEPETSGGYQSSGSSERR